uniref:Moesin/ezrin/radixin homolog 1 n=2 Tax=Parascaris univalens TaxID=6257 RepID=A0A914ZVB4_PARUN
MGIFSLSSRGGGKNLLAKVSTMDADLEKIAIEPDWTGRQLYDTVCRIIGLREIWYFGLQFVNKKGIPCWLQMEKKVCKQEVPKQVDGSVHFLFLVKFYPEDVEEELIQDITRHLFFLQIKQSILSMQLYCSAEASVLLASYAVQAIQGDCSEDSHLVLGELLPECVIKQYDMSAQMWEERIRRWWANNAGQSREDAEMEYLRVAQDLEMYGIQYYPICNSKETDLNLGVSAQGIGIYKESNRITPRPFFSWSEIKNISFKNKLFTMRTMDKSTITFRAKDMSINMSILDLCIGTHNLYLRRRQPDLLEVQQMKAQAKEQRIRRMQEQNRLAREREQRIQAETDRDRYKNEFNAANEELCNLKEAMKKTEETAQLLAEKARVSEEEALVLSKRASEAEAECQRMKISQIKSEETKMSLERKARDAELVAHRLLQETERRNREAFMYRSQFLGTEPSWPQSWYSAYALPCSQQYPAHHHVISSSSSGDGGYLAQQNEESTMSNPLHPHVKVQRSPMFRSEAYLNGPPPDPSTNQFISSDLTALRSEIEKSRAEYNEKTKQLKEKMSEFRAEIESLKVEDRQTEHDRIHAANVQKGIDKYSTLRKSGAGSAKSRVQVFDGL